jgi:hypothetical protein
MLWVSFVWLDHPSALSLQSRWLVAGDPASTLKGYYSSMLLIMLDKSLPKA